MIKLENNKYFSYDMIGEFHSSGKWIHPRRTIDSFEIILVIEGMLYIAEEKQKYTLKKINCSCLSLQRSITDMSLYRSLFLFFGCIFIPILKFRSKFSRKLMFMKLNSFLKSFSI